MSRYQKALVLFFCLVVLVLLMFSPKAGSSLAEEDFPNNLKVLAVTDSISTAQ